MLTAVIAHTSRLDQATALRRRVDGNKIFIDDGTLGATGNHHRALAWATEPVIVLEDDAIPTPHFLNLTALWIARYPNRLISFYLGTSRPPTFQPIVDRLIDEADNAGRDYIELDHLIHGVCYYAPNPQDLAEAIDLGIAADFSIGNAWTQLTGKPVIYPTSSLVDHNDQPSLHQDDGLPRHARRLAA